MTYEEAVRKFRDATKGETDPIKRGQKIHGLIMMRIGKYVSDEAELFAIGRMIDTLVISVSLKSVEKGLDVPSAKCRELVAEKLRSLGLL